MEPTVSDGDYLLVERVSIARGKIKKGDVVVAGQPRRSTNFSHVLKRITALEEEKVSYWDEIRWKKIIEEIPANHVWLEGDNSGHSLDSRNYGPVPTSRLEYRVLLRLWPLRKFGRLSSPGPNSTTNLMPANSPGLTTPVDACLDYALLDEKSDA